MNWSASELNKEILNLYFWKNQRKAVAYLIIGIIIFFALLPYSKPTMAEPVSFISILIFLFLFLGIYQFLSSIVRLAAERDFLIAANSATIIHIKENKNIDLKELRNILGRNQELHLNRMFNHIISEAKVRKFESSILTINPYKDDFLTDFLKINNFQKIALQIGILGTFLGLIIAFKELSPNQGLDIARITTALQLSFSTSIGGLQVAIILGLFNLHLREKQDELFQLMEITTDNILALARKAENEYLASDFAAVNARINQLADNINNQSNVIENQTSEVIKGIVKLKKSFESLLTNLTKEQERFLGEINNVYDKFSPETISKELKMSLAKSSEEITTVLGTSLNSTTSKYSELSDVILQMKDSIEILVDQLKLQIQFSNEQTLKSKSEIFEVIENLGNAQTNFVHDISGNHISKQLSESILTVGKNISNQCSEEAKKILPELQMLSSKLEMYNQIIRQDITQRTPSKLLLQAMTLSWQFVIEISKHIILSIKQLIELIKNNKK